MPTKSLNKLHNTFPTPQRHSKFNKCLKSTQKACCQRTSLSVLIALKIGWCFLQKVFSVSRRFSAGCLQVYPDNLQPSLNQKKNISRLQKRVQTKTAPIVLLHFLIWHAFSISHFPFSTVPFNLLAHDNLITHSFKELKCHANWNYSWFKFSISTKAFVPTRNASLEGWSEICICPLERKTNGSKSGHRRLEVSSGWSF